jgi:hypothetical protein
MITVQNQMPLTSGNTVPSMRPPSQAPMANATTVKKKPDSADAAPAICGNGATAPVCVHGW